MKICKTLLLILSLSLLGCSGDNSQPQSNLELRDIGVSREKLLSEVPTFTIYTEDMSSFSGETNDKLMMTASYKADGLITEVLFQFRYEDSNKKKTRSNFEKYASIVAKLFPEEKYMPTVLLNGLEKKIQSGSYRKDPTYFNSNLKGEISMGMYAKIENPSSFLISAKVSPREKFKAKDNK